MIQVYTDKLLPGHCLSCEHYDGCKCRLGENYKRWDGCPLITWQPGTTAPKDGKPFLARWAGDYFTVVYTAGAFYTVYGFKFTAMNTSDWLPLPLAGA